LTVEKNLKSEFQTEFHWNSVEIDDCSINCRLPRSFLPLGWAQEVPLRQLRHEQQGAADGNVANLAV
jgi:hypothetical protein